MGSQSFFYNRLLVAVSQSTKINVSIAQLFISIIFFYRTLIIYLCSLLTQNKKSTASWELLKIDSKLKADEASAEIKDLLKQHGNKVIGEVTLSQIYQGMRGITGLVTETSLLDAQEGIRFRGYSIPELREKLPKAPDGSEPLPEGFFYLMLIGELPTEEDVHHLTNVWQRRSHVPNHVFAYY